MTDDPDRPPREEFHHDPIEHAAVSGGGTRTNRGVARA
jgi:hypothetical protein